MSDTTADARHGRRGKVPKLAAAAVAIVLSAAMATVALAAIPDAGGVIHGCFRSNGGNGNEGALRVVDPALSSCSKQETAISWNQSGPQGPPGTPGPPGPQGPPGDNIFAVVLFGFNPSDPLNPSALATGNHVVGATTEPAGGAKVTFDRAVANCAYAPSTRATSVDVAARPDVLDPNSVLVQTAPDAFFDFTLIVAC